MEETVVWEGGPDQKQTWIDPVFVLCALSIVLLPVALWKFLVIKNTRYTLTTERLKIQRGVLSRRIEELELYRVKDTTFDQPLSLRLFSLGRVIVRSSDVSTPAVILDAVTHGEALREQIRKHAELRRDKKGVRQIDI